MCGLTLLPLEVVEPHDIDVRGPGLWGTILKKVVGLRIRPKISFLC